MQRPVTKPDGEIARLYATVVGVGLVLGGVGGFFFDGSFGTGAEINNDEIFGTLLTNGWNNVFHLTLGLAALTLAGVRPRIFAVVGGVGLTALGMWGLAAADAGNATLWGTFVLNTPLSLIHLLAGLSGLVAYVADGGRVPRVPLPRGGRGSNADERQRKPTPSGKRAEEARQAPEAR